MVQRSSNGSRREYETLPEGATCPSDLLWPNSPAVIPVLPHPTPQIIHTRSPSRPSLLYFNPFHTNPFRSNPYPHSANRAPSFPTIPFSSSLSHHHCFLHTTHQISPLPFPLIFPLTPNKSLPPLPARHITSSE
jgi:hypothetical protein